MTATLMESSEKDRVESHRRNFFREVLGDDIPADDIEQLVHSDISPHEVRNLKNKGWSVEFILKVLL